MLYARVVSVVPHTVSIKLILKLKRRTVLSRTVLFSTQNPGRTRGGGEKQKENIARGYTVHEIVTEQERSWF